jgi:hypothetical protein
VFDDISDPQVLFTRRFYVVQRRVKVDGKVTASIAANTLHSHQRIEFQIDHQDYPIMNPRDEVKVAVLQNYRWDNALTNLKPRFIRDELLIYNDPNDQKFPGGREFRYFDTRTINFYSERIREIKSTAVSTEVWVNPDPLTTYEPYVFNRDKNGQYIIDNKEGNGEPNIDADYCHVHFTLNATYPYPSGKLYLFGELTNWNLNKAGEMHFNADQLRYESALWLKQGFYDYQYVFVPEHDPKLWDNNPTEGNVFDTENEYQIFIYHRGPGDLYDALVGFTLISSVR